MKTTQPIDGSNIGRRNFLKIGAAAAASCGIAAPAIAQPRVRAMRFGHMLPTETVYHKAIAMFADEVGKISGGKMKIDVYPSSQLGSIPEMLSQLKVGSLTMSMAVPAWYSNFMKPIDAFTLPYIVSSPERLKAALDGNLGKEINRLGQGAGFHVFGYWLLGGRHIVNKVRPVNVPADCQGLKLRVINSQVYIQAFRALGASTVAMDPAELYVAMQQGVIDGFEYPLPDLLAFKLNEVIKYISLDNHTTDFFLVSMNKGIWDGLGAGGAGHPQPGDEDRDGLAVEGAAGGHHGGAGEAQDDGAGERDHACEQEALRRCDPPGLCAVRKLDRQGLPGDGDQGRG